MKQRKRFIQFTLLLILIILTSGAFASRQVVFASKPVPVDRSLEDSRIVAPADTFRGTPAYDSGWYDFGIRPDPLAVLFTHNVGGDPDDYVVRLTCKDSSIGTYNCTDTALNVNAHWYGLTDTTISVWAGSARPNEVRVQIYMIVPTYDSDWDVLLVRPEPIAVEFTHNLGRDVVIHLVSLECKDDSELGTYDCTDHAFNINADWYGLTGTVVSAWVDNGPRPDEIRIRLFAVIPDYDSGWETIGIRPDPLSIVLTHDLGGDPDEYFVDLECRDDSTSLGTYGCTSFSFNKQANWFGLTGSQINVWVTGGSNPGEVRVRILTPKKVYLPMLMKGLCP